MLITCLDQFQVLIAFLQPYTPIVAHTYPGSGKNWNGRKIGIGGKIVRGKNWNERKTRMGGKIEMGGKTGMGGKQEWADKAESDGISQILDNGLVSTIDDPIFSPSYIVWRGKSLWVPIENDNYHHL